MRHPNDFFASEPLSSIEKLNFEMISKTAKKEGFFRVDIFSHQNDHHENYQTSVILPLEENVDQAKNAARASV